jgi:hypothetical protein
MININLYITIATVLWDEYGYTLPDSPGSMAIRIVDAIKSEQEKEKSPDKE